jgi:hypothetical protein
VDTNATELDKPPKYEYKNLVFNYGQSKEADGGIKVNLKYKFKRSDNLKIKLVQFLGIKKYFIPNVSYIKISPVKGKNQIKMEVACTPKIKVYEKPFIEMVESFLKSGSESLKNYILPRI